MDCRQKARNEWQRESAAGNVMRRWLSVIYVADLRQIMGEGDEVDKENSDGVKCGELSM